MNPIGKITRLNAQRELALTHGVTAALGTVLSIAQQCTLAYTERFSVREFCRVLEADQVLRHADVERLVAIVEYRDDMSPETKDQYFKAMLTLLTVQRAPALPTFAP